MSVVFLVTGIALVAGVTAGRASEVEPGAQVAHGLTVRAVWLRPTASGPEQRWHQAATRISQIRGPIRRFEDLGIARHALSMATDAVDWARHPRSRARGAVADARHPSEPPAEWARQLADWRLQAAAREIAWIGTFSDVRGIAELPRTQHALWRGYYDADSVHDSQLVKRAWRLLGRTLDIPVRGANQITTALGRRPSLIRPARSMALLGWADALADRLDGGIDALETLEIGSAPHIVSPDSHHYPISALVEAAWPHAEEAYGALIANETLRALRADRQFFGNPAARTPVLGSLADALTAAAP